MYRRNILIAALCIFAATVPAQGMRPTERAQARQAKRLNAAALAASATQPTDDWTSTISKLSDGTLADIEAVTNGQTVVISGFIIRLNSSGGTNNATNTITIPLFVNGLFAVINTGTSNHLAIAKAGLWKGAAVELGENEGMIVIGANYSFYGVE